MIAMNTGCGRPWMAVVGAHQAWSSALLAGSLDILATCSLDVHALLKLITRSLQDKRLSPLQDPRAVCAPARATGRHHRAAVKSAECVVAREIS
ncbi:hypothetical protein TSOC_000210 [Tetrabaena socialis]|uniref:Uncharacterized protein n=1 Tax=Tetrabaena socialis TaxID=47790 RepID=A0A2J8AK11_9CHLO|nr:hypothetical protein TSOC_000210 [Tetrabaena socialis]|eukprot:PNH12862.1 hypothetical protein TSOC_000210 [Tetrabaena socialis]